MNSLGLSDDAKAILLLCGHFGGEGGPAPLTLSGYNRLASWLKDHGYRPKNLVDGSALEMLQQEVLDGLELPRLVQLLERGAAVAFAVERWMNKGMWVLCRSDADYPQRLRNHLGTQAPPILYGFGNQQLLQSGGLAVVGSRNVDDEGAEFAEEVSRRAAEQGMAIISGAARGVDQIAMRSALEEGGPAVGVLADSLLKTALRPEAREAIRSNQLTLVSSFDPEAGFHVGSAMERNKYIYGLSDFALVVSAEYEKGGTWAGAVEELRRDPHVPLFVRVAEHIPKGNKELLKRGAISFPDKPWSRPFSELLDSAVPKEDTAIKIAAQGDLFTGMQISEKAAYRAVTEDLRPEPTTGRGEGHHKTVFEAVLPVLLGALAQPRKADDLAKELDVQKTQVDKWLKKAVAHGVIKKITKPVRFVRVVPAGEDLLFDEKVKL